MFPIISFLKIIRRLMFAATFGATVYGSAALFADEQRYRLDIAEGALNKTLIQLGRQTNMSIVFSTETTERFQSKAIAGEMGMKDALRLLIGDACLTYAQITADMYAIRSGCNEKTPVHAISDGKRIPSSFESPAKIEELVVLEPYSTGSRIRIPKAGLSSNAEIITRDEIDRSSNQDVGELLRTLTLVSGNPTSTLVTNGGDGTASITLRGLPANNTLVLLNGRRTNGGGLSGASVDLNSIPIGIIERIEIFKEGASALYGSDAIAGVVNVITRTPVNEISASSFYGLSSRGDLATFNSNITFGKIWGKSQFSLGLNFYDQQALLSKDRSLSRSSNDINRGGVDKRSSAAAPAIINIEDNFISLRSGFDGSDADDFRNASADDLFEYRDYTVSIVPSRRWSIFSQYSFEINPDVNVYFEGLYTNTESKNSLAPTPLFTILQGAYVSADNTYNPFGASVVDIRRRLVELGSRVTTYSTDSFRAVAGINGTVGKYHWDLSYSYNKTQSKDRLRNLLNLNNVQLALGAADNCVGECVALNLFGPVGSITPEMLDYIRTNSTNKGTSLLSSIILNVDFSLFNVPAGEVELATGIEFRVEELSLKPDLLSRTSQTIGGVDLPFSNGKRYITEAYLESYIPILKDKPLIKSLDLQLAVRNSHYSDFGNSLNPRVAINYTPMGSFHIRASYSEAFRAASLFELEYGEQESFVFVDDPCSSPENVALLPGCSQQSDPTLNQFLTILGGNSELKPEQAKTYTAGFVWKIKKLAGFSISADWYQIRESDVIGSSPNFIVNENARSLGFSDRIKRDANGNISEIIATQINIGKRNISGLDFLIQYLPPESKWGHMQFALSSTHLLAFKEQINPLAAFDNIGGTFQDAASDGRGTLPNWKVNFSASFESRYWGTSYSLYYVSSLQEKIPSSDKIRTINSWLTHNLQLSYNGPASYWMKVTLGGRNLLDKAPPFVAQAFNDSYDSRTYDITGRFLYLRLEKTF